MNKVYQSKNTQDEDIDLFQLLELLWREKWLIVAMVMVGIFAGIFFIFNKDESYVSRISYTIETIPPFHDPDRLLRDFQNSFKSEAIFNEWKKNSPNSVLTLEDFSSTEVFDGFSVSKKIEYLKTRFSPFDIIVNTNDLKLMSDYFEYCKFINNHLKGFYVARAKKELEMVSNHLSDYSRVDNGSVFFAFLSIDRFITEAEAEDGSEIFKFEYPTIPKKISPQLRLILIGSSFLGFVTGVIFVIFRNILIRRQVE